jgi:isoleucyl-tRNA synthetase
MRLWVASADYRDDVRLSMNILEGLSEGYRKIRNTVRYALSNLFDFDPVKDAVAPAALLPLDQWVSAKLDLLTEKVKKAYETYEFHLVYHSIVEFCSNELSAQYFDIQKDTLYTSRKDGAKRRSAQTALFRIAHDLLVMLAPVTSFTSEEAFAYLPGKRPASVFLARFPAVQGVADDAKVAEYDRLFDVRRAVLPLLEGARRDKLIGKSLEAQVTLTATDGLKALLERHLADLPEFFIVSQVQLADVAGEKAVVVAEGLKAEVTSASGARCPRCWAYRPEVGAQELCDRCTEAVSG